MSFKDLIPFHWKKDDVDVPVHDQSVTEQRDPFGSFHREFDQMFDRFRREFDQLTPSQFGGAVQQWNPTVNLRETDDGIVVEAELPGITPDDLDLHVSDGVLHITGERHDKRETDEKGYKRIESSYGRFHRAIRLPDGILSDNPEATLKDGVLTVSMARDPDHAKTPHRRIPITAE